MRPALECVTVVLPVIDEIPNDSDSTHHMRVTPKKLSPLAILGPGLLVAATGVGAGDLASAGFSGGLLGLSVLWAVALGAVFKLVLTEGLARWQVATGRTLLEGVADRIGRWCLVLFLLYFLPWSFFTGAAMISACGVAANSLVPWRLEIGSWSGDQVGKVVYGAAHSVVGVALAWIGGFKVFEKVMAGLIALMFLCVIGCAVLLGPDLVEVARGLFVPTLPRNAEELSWIVALMGGVGGTVTILTYGYWIRELDRDRPEHLGTCRIDLGVGYLATAMFGMGVVIIASGAVLSGGGMGLLVALSERLGETLGPLGRWIFLVGAWGAVFSSLLGVWQGVPYLFADIWDLVRGSPASGASSKDTPTRLSVSTQSWAYRGYLLGIATVPMLGVLTSFKSAQKAYAIVGAGFLPVLALALLFMNGRSAWVGKRFRNGWLATSLLIIVMGFASLAGWLRVRPPASPPTTEPGVQQPEDPASDTPRD